MNKVVIARIFGGLGNQLFCYAAARRLSLVNNMPLKLDIVSGFRSDFRYRREYLLHQFNIKSEVASAGESFNYVGGKLSRYFNKGINKFLTFEKRFYIKEQSFERFEEGILELKPKRSLYMEGYWQSERYFKDIEKIIRDDFKITASFDSVTLKEAEEIKRTGNSVCIGVRLYKEKSGSGRNTAFPADYYMKAIDEITKSVKTPHFFIFSEDPDWVKNNLSFTFPHTVISYKPENIKAYEDLWLMALCRNFIISDSTYHWWGAWLSGNKEKIVIAPSSGFHNKDVVPEGWRTICY